MHEIIYSSIATKKFSDAELTDLLNVSRLKNEQLGLTGMLIYGGGTFVQLIEGGIEAARELYEFVQKDPRHTQIEVSHQQKISERSFSAWSMAYKKFGYDPTYENISGYEPLDTGCQPKNFIPGTVNAGMTVLRRHLDKLQYELS